MKKLIVFIFLIVLMCCINLPFIKSFNLEQIFPNAQVEVYIKNECCLDGYNYICNGEGKIVFIDVGELKTILRMNNVLGYTLKVKNESLNDVFNKLDIISVDVKENMYYGISGIFDKKLNSYNKYNFECVKLNDEIHIGTPILLGSY